MASQLRIDNVALIKTLALDYKLLAKHWAREKLVLSLATKFPSPIQEQF